MSDDEADFPAADEWAAHVENAEWWHAAIGRVVTTAAGLEAAIGTLLHAVEAGDNDHLYALMIGTLMRRMRSQLLALAQRDTQLAMQIGALIDKVDALLEQRNDVVHGWWRFGVDGVSAIRGRAHRKSPDLEVHQVERDDIVLLAAQLDGARHAALRYAASAAASLGGSTAR